MAGRLERKTLKNSPKATKSRRPRPSRAAWSLNLSQCF